jgi:hypothetical protein
MTIEIPATGICKQQGWENTHVYHVNCSCTDGDHAVQTWIEIEPDADIPEVAVTFYVQAHYPSWRGFFRRLGDAWQILLGNPLTRSHGLLLEKQTAINFAAAINRSIEELDANSQSDK